jgi:hypothetical protein
VLDRSFIHLLPIPDSFLPLQAAFADTVNTISESVVPYSILVSSGKPQHSLNSHTPIILDELPNEILLAITIRVPLGEGDLRTLQCVNRHLRDLIQKHESFVIQEIAELRFPFAARVATLSSTAHDLSVKWLETLHNITEDVNEFVDEMTYIDRPAKLERMLLDEDKGASICSDWLRKGLHMFRGWHGEAEHLGPALPLGVEPDAIDMRPQYHRLTDAITPSECLALRHTSLTILAILSGMDDDGVLLGINPEDPTLPEQIFSQRVLITTLEDNLLVDLEFFPQLKRVLRDAEQDAEQDADEDAVNVPDSVAFQRHDMQEGLQARAQCYQTFLLEDFKRVQDGEYIQPFEFEHYITRRIRDIYLEWEEIEAEERQRIMRGFQIADEEEERARELVKSYVLTDYDTPEWKAYRDWVLDQGRVA